MQEDEAITCLREAVAQGRIQWHQHALERLLERGNWRSEVMDAILRGEVIECYPEDRPFPSCLLLHFAENPLHVVAAGDPIARLCHVITVYRPDLDHFEADFKTRRNRA